MLRWICLLLAAMIVALSVAEYVTHHPPLELATALLAGDEPNGPGGSPKTVIRMGVAAWQMDEFPWQAVIRRYEQAHPDVRVRLSILPEGSLNSMLLFWASDYTEYDLIVAWSDSEINPLIEYNWKSADPARRSLPVNVADVLTAEQMSAFKPALLAGASRKDPATGRVNVYEVPWMGEVLALNYNRQYLRQAGVEKPPATWEEVETACRKIRDARLTHNGQPVSALSLNFSQSGFFAQNSYVPMLASLKKGRGILDARGRLDITCPEAAEVFRTLKRWQREGFLSPNCKNSDSVEQDLRVLRTAMYPHWLSRGLWAIKDHGPEVIGAAPTPGADVGGSLVATYGCVVPKCSPVAKQAIEFGYEAFGTDKHGFQSTVSLGWPGPGGQLTGGGKMPANSDIYALPGMRPEIVELGKSLDKGYSYPDPVNWAQVADILVVEFQKFLDDETDRLTAEQALDAAAERIRQEVYKD